MGQAILHIHTTFSDGLATVEQILDEAEAQSAIDVVGFTDHDDVRAFAAAQRWKEAHPDSRVQPLWGVEQTIRAFKHLLVYKFEPPYPSHALPKFLPLETAVHRVKHFEGMIVIPHVDTLWVGMGRHRLGRVAAELGIDGIELLTPFQGSARSVGNLARMNEQHRLLELGGSDAHHLEDLYKVIVDFTGHTVADLGRACREGTVRPRWGWNGATVPLRRQAQQHARALIYHPYLQMRSWARMRVDAVLAARNGHLS